MMVMIKKIIINVGVFDRLFIIIVGVINEISKSKMINKMDNIKKFVENGIFIFVFSLNPHSKLIFILFCFLFLFRFTVMMRIVNKLIIVIIIVRKFMLIINSFFF
jgi:hypothetical protein